MERIQNEQGESDETPLIGRTEEGRQKELSNWEIYILVFALTISVCLLLLNGSLLSTVSLHLLKLQDAADEVYLRRYLA